MKYFVTIVLTLVIAAAASAQLTDQARLEALTQSNSLGVKPATSPFSLLDLSKMRWYHTYSLSFFSGSGQTGSMGLLNSMMIYELSSKFTLGVNLAVAHDIAGVSRFGSQSVDFYPGFRLDFHPSSKFQMSLSVQRVPADYRYYYMPSVRPKFWSPY
ncbi:MAG: hypothetical protein AB1744_08890 [Candidatus Zixiibacteriota bacterium]